VETINSAGANMFKVLYKFGTKFQSVCFFISFFSALKPQISIPCFFFPLVVFWCY